jgi:hypothetical protein
MPGGWSSSSCHRVYELVMVMVSLVGAAGSLAAQLGHDLAQQRQVAPASVTLRRTVAACGCLLSAPPLVLLVGGAYAAVPNGRCDVRVTPLSEICLWVTSTAKASLGVAWPSYRHTGKLSCPRFKAVTLTPGPWLYDQVSVLSRLPCIRSERSAYKSAVPSPAILGSVTVDVVTAARQK